jgi:hypothetical protein
MDQDNDRGILGTVGLDVKLGAIRASKARLDRRATLVLRGGRVAGRSSGFEEKAQNSPHDECSGDGQDQQPCADHQVQGRVVEAEVRIEIGPLIREIVTPGMFVPPVAEVNAGSNQDKREQAEKPDPKDRGRDHKAKVVAASRVARKNLSFRIVLKTLLGPAVKQLIVSGPQSRALC